MTTYYVEYTYENPWGNCVNDRHYCETKEEMTAFIEKIKSNRTLLSLTLITYEKLI